MIPGEDDQKTNDYIIGKKCIFPRTRWELVPKKKREQEHNPGMTAKEEIMTIAQKPSPWFLVTTTAGVGKDR